MKKKNETFEEELRRLEEIIGRFDSGDMTLDESLALYDEGVRLAAGCKETLEKAEQKITMLENSPEEK